MDKVDVYRWRLWLAAQKYAVTMCKKFKTADNEWDKAVYFFNSTAWLTDFNYLNN